MIKTNKQRRGEYKLGRNRAALVTSTARHHRRRRRARWRAQPPQRHGVGQFPVLMLFAVVSTFRGDDRDRSDGERYNRR